MPNRTDAPMPVHAGSVVGGVGRTRVRLDFYRVGDDLLLVLSGGEPHVGAATLAEPGAGGAVRVRTVSGRGHREGELTRLLAREAARSFGRRTLVVGGIHLDRITREEIEAIRANTCTLLQNVDIPGF